MLCTSYYILHVHLLCQKREEKLNNQETTSLICSKLPWQPDESSDFLSSATVYFFSAKKK